MEAPGLGLADLSAPTREPVFLDRDGCISALRYYEDAGVLDTPYRAEDLELLPGAAEAVASLVVAGHPVIVVSNQPGVAKGKFTLSDLERMDAKLRLDLGVPLAGTYYCTHHPSQAGPDAACTCRKPQPGLLLKACRDLGLARQGSWMIGDSITDILAGAAVGARTVLLGTYKCDLCRLMQADDIQPDYVVRDLAAAAAIVLKRGAANPEGWAPVFPFDAPRVRVISS